MMNSIKQKSIDEVLRKYNFEPEHAKQVKKLSLLLFDKTKEHLHNFSDSERTLLEASALLHDIGHFISSDEHHKHSYILITQEKLEGFSLEEIEIIGNIARYHRGKPPEKYHNNFAKLPDKTAQNLVKKLCSILRLADSLDKTHRSAVEDLECLYDSFSKTLYVIISSNIKVFRNEIKSAEKKKILLEEEFGIQVEFKIKEFN